tara:strand:+ start:18162 stop:18647 length:486 start_codon:yes stop_codon:yes gene_type:complete
MEVVQLNNVLKREDPSDLYDITEISFSFPYSLTNGYNIYYVTEFEEMRLDLISNLLYGDVDHVDFLCSINNIKNPLSIKRGDAIAYVSSDDVSQFKVQNADKDDVRRKISNIRKRTKVDPNRTNYLNSKSFSLPPTITKRDYRAVKHKDGKITIGDNIFNV